MTLLDEVVPFMDHGQASVFEHAMIALRGLFHDRGEHGLCLIGDGDWNDSLNEIALEGKGQSAWLTIATVYAMRVLEEIARAAGRTGEADELKQMSAELSDQVNRTAWDGRWYIYAINDHGQPVGSDRNTEGKIHLNSQTWAIFAGVATGERLASVLNVIDNDLDTRWGQVLIHPAYTAYVRGIGKVSGKNPGMAENGPVYSHGIAFKMLADYAIGRGDKAFESYMKLCPAAADKDPRCVLRRAVHRPSLPDRPSLPAAFRRVAVFRQYRLAGLDVSASLRAYARRPPVVRRVDHRPVHPVGVEAVRGGPPVPRGYLSSAAEQSVRRAARRQADQA